MAAQRCSVQCGPGHAAAAAVPVCEPGRGPLPGGGGCLRPGRGADSGNASVSIPGGVPQRLHQNAGVCCLHLDLFWRKQLSEAVRQDNGRSEAELGNI